MIDGPGRYVPDHERWHQPLGGHDIRLNSEPLSSQELRRIEAAQLAVESLQGRSQSQYVGPGKPNQVIATGMTDDEIKARFKLFLRLIEVGE